MGLYVVCAKSEKTGREIRGERAFSREDAQRMASRLNKEVKGIRHWTEPAERPKSSEFISVTRAASEAQLTTGAIFDLMDGRMLPSVFIDGKRMIPRAAWDRWMESRSAGKRRNGSGPTSERGGYGCGCY